ncbi:MAG TPA: hypothetical protein DCS48_13695 [Desulfovibrio sp.]|nr:hypothetical protein [Desulfovibrio sp.]
MQRVLCFVMCWLIFPAFVYAADIPIVFKLRDGLDPENVYVTFYNCISNVSSITGTYNGPTQNGLSLNTSDSFSMAEITGTTAIATGVPAGVPAVLISEFKSGRIFISYDSKMKSFGCTQPSTEPSSNDPSLGIRFQPMELDIELGNSTNSVETPIINTNLTYIDYASIALSLTVKNSTTAVTNSPLLTTVSSETLTDTLGRASLTAYSTVQPSSSDRLPGSKFTRVLSPTSSDMSGKFNDWTHYLKTTLNQSTTVDGKPIKIQGLFGGVSGQPANNGGGANVKAARNQTQSYDYHVTVDANGDVTMTAQAGSGDGTVAGIAVANRGDGVGQVNITIDFDDLNAATGIYGNNPPYTIAGIGKTAGVENDYYGWVVGDLLAGLSWGFPGSPVKFNATYANNLVIGDMSSVEWYGGTAADGTIYSVPLSPAGRGFTYDKAQADDRDYHVYAAGLKGITGAYGFGLEDRNGATLINFNRIDQPNSYLEVGVDTEGLSSVQPSPTQDTGVTVKVSDFVPKQLTQLEIDSQYGLNDFTTHTSMCAFNATIDPAGSVGVFMVDTNAIPNGPVNGLTFMKFYSNGTPAEYKVYASSGPQYTDGYWWITDLEGNHKVPTDILAKGTHYYINFAIKDNGEFDENATLGEIKDPLAVGSFGASGCVMNPRANLKYELLALLGIAAGLCVIRIFRSVRS